MKRKIEVGGQIFETEAPYTDPDGYPSWQPSEEVRHNDAVHRRQRFLNENVKTAREALKNAQALVKFATEQLTIAEAVAQSYDPFTYEIPARGFTGTRTEVQQ
jgi:hypothetical protein